MVFTMLRNLRPSVSCAIIAALLASCAMIDDPIPLPEGRWEMVDSSFLEPGRLPGIARATLQIANGRIAVFSGCNSGTGAVASVDGRMVVSETMASTRRACPEPIGGFEGRYFKLLRSRPYFRTEGNMLILATDDESLRFRRIAEPAPKK